MDQNLPKPSESKFTVHLVGHAHIDLAYRWRWSETIFYAAVETFENVLRRMEEVPDLTFAQSQMALYEAIEQHHPDLFKRIKAQIKAGRWIVVGGMWVESDMNIPCGESLIRQFLVGRNYARQKLGADTSIAWLPDVFGHNANLPQILAGCGIQVYAAKRCLPEDTPIFRWEGIDGSSVVVYCLPDNYSGQINAQLPERIMKWAEGTPHCQALYLYGAGDHGGGPRESDLDGFEKLKLQKHQFSFQFGSPETYFKKIAEKNDPLPVIRGELNFFARGCYTSQSRVKEMNRKGENLLLTAEKFAANVLFIHRKSAGQRFELLDAWKKLLWLQFHDNLPGTSIGPVYDDNELIFAEIETKGKAVLNEALEIIGARLDTRGEGAPVMVFNPLSWNRTEPVETVVKFRKLPETLIALNETGNAAPVQILEKWEEDFGWHALRIVFIARDVPSIGYRLFGVQTGTVNQKESDIHSEKHSIENEFLKVEIDPKTGEISQIYDKLNARKTLAAPAGLQVIPEREINTAWSILPTDQIIKPQLSEPVRLIEQGQARTGLKIVYYYEESTFILTVSLAANSPVVQFHLKADWHQSDTCLKMAFPTTIEADRAAYEIPFGHIERPTNGDEVPALKWIDLSGKTFGASLLNDRKYGFDVKDNVLRMTLLRGAIDMDPRADDGVHEANFRFYPHKKNWRCAHTIRRAYELNVPLIARTERRHEGSQAGWGHPPEGPLPANFSFLKIEPENLIVTALKPKHEQFGPPDVILRFYETHGKAVTAIITFPVPLAEAFECNMLEEPLEEPIDGKGIKVDGNQVQLPIGAHEIKTLHLKYAARFAGASGGEWDGMELDA